MCISYSQLQKKKKITTKKTSYPAGKEFSADSGYNVGGFKQLVQCLTNGFICSEQIEILGELVGLVWKKLGEEWKLEMTIVM